MMTLCSLSLLCPILGVEREEAVSQVDLQGFFHSSLAKRMATWSLAQGDMRKDHGPSSLLQRRHRSRCVVSLDRSESEASVVPFVAMASTARGVGRARPAADRCQLLGQRAERSGAAPAERIWRRKDLRQKDASIGLGG